MMELKPGDVFCTENPADLGGMINWIQKFWSVDNEASFSHSGLIIDREGTTIEALSTVRMQNLFDAYSKKRVLIARNVDMNPVRFQMGIEKIRPNMGQWYPVFRLLLHLLRLAKYIHWGRVVCSELTAKFLVGCGFRANWYGITPDNLADEWRMSKYYQIVFEGELACREVVERNDT